MGCTEREVGCHGKCAKYAEFRSEREKEYQKGIDEYKGAYWCQKSERSRRTFLKSGKRIRP